MGDYSNWSITFIEHFDSFLC